MMPKVKRGVSAVRARNSTLPTRWPWPGGTTIGSGSIAPSCQRGSGSRTGRPDIRTAATGACSVARGASRPYLRSMTAVSFPISPKAVRQIGIFLLAYLLYSAARWITVGDLGAAQAHADWIIGVERDLHVASEASVQQALSGSWALWVLNHLYLIAQLIVVPGALIFTYTRSHEIYTRLRDTILATWLISIPVYAAFPVAPPRLAHMGLVDTITSQSGFSMDSSLTTSFYNQLAAVPSLHVGFAVAIGIAVASVLRNPVAKGLALLWGPTIGLAVVATGNHFVFDIVAGIVASALGYAFGLLALRPRRRWGLAPALAVAANSAPTPRAAGFARSS